MKTFCGAFPVLPGKTEAGREFAKACMGPRHAEFSEALRKQGISKESWFLQKTPQGDLIVVYLEAQDVEKVFGGEEGYLAKSKGAFEVWFKEQVKSITGVDLGQPATEPPPEEIVHI